MTSRDFCMQCTASLASLSERAAASASAAKLEDLNRTANPDEWSVAQIFEHMRLGHQLYVDTIRSALDAATPVAASGDVRFTWLGKLIAREAGPSGRAAPPRVMLPGAGPFGADVIEHWTLCQSQIAALAQRAADYDVSAIRVRNPIIRFIPMNLADCFAIVLGHTERHVAQIENRLKR